jgi:1-deoxy-D-xylulose-5-phosphate reductoisomerase
MNHGKKLVTVLGATGSIGVSTLDVVARHPDLFGVFALTAHRQVDKLLEQCLAHRPAYAVLDSSEDALALQSRLDAAGCCTEVLVGAAALADVAAAPEVDMVMAAIVGAAGLVPALAAARAGKRILLANKEALVMSGHSSCRRLQRPGQACCPSIASTTPFFRRSPRVSNEAFTVAVSIASC